MRPSPGVPDMSAAVIIMTRSGLARRPRPPRWRLLAGRRCRGSARARHTSRWDGSVKASARQRVWSGFFFFFLLNTKPSEERRPAVTQSWEAGLRNVLQEYPDSAGSGLLMRLLTADPVSPPAEGQRSAGIAHPVSRRGREQIKGEVPASWGGGGINTGVTLICCETVLAAGSFL